ncbi:Hypp4287 [Branchiostoma lanceolatum]|uniref:Hypp4287 protein n=1 Tax=Branchiostoma lanceolatum TaxID=7740 RepID=A0A8K0EXV3_BRALA|nr:Hypp4287 [Branchiostoma lanceolatum]
MVNFLCYATFRSAILTKCAQKMGKVTIFPTNCCVTELTRTMSAHVNLLFLLACLLFLTSSVDAAGTMSTLAETLGFFGMWYGIIGISIVIIFVIAFAGFVEK